MKRSGSQAKQSTTPQPTQARKSVNIGLWFPGGGHNMGNECTLAAAVEGLRRLDPDIELYGISWNPGDTASRHGIDSFPIKGRGGRVAAKAFAPTAGTSNEKGKPHSRLRRGRLHRRLKSLASPLLELAYIRGARQCLKRIDLLVFAGTGIVTDSWGGFRRFPYRIFLWTLLSRRRTKVAFVSVGAGPIDGTISKKLLAHALSEAAYRSFRDHESRRVVESLGISETNHVRPDLVFGLSVPDSAKKLAKGSHDDVIVTGIPYRKPGWWERPSSDVYRRYLESMAEFVRWLLGHGRTIRLLGTQSEMDPVFIRDLQTRLGEWEGASPGRLIVQHTNTYEQVMRQLAQARIVVTSRFHGVVFSYRLGIPVLAVSYHPKIRHLMKAFRQDDFCLEIEQVVVDELRQKFIELDESRSRYSSEIRETSTRYCAQLDDQYRRLLQL